MSFTSYGPIEKFARKNESFFSQLKTEQDSSIKYSLLCIFQNTAGKSMNLFLVKARDKNLTMFAFRFPVAVVKFSRSFRSIVKVKIFCTVFKESNSLKLFREWWILAARITDFRPFRAPIRNLLFMLDQFAI